MKTDLEQERELLRQTEAAAAELFLRAIGACYQKPATAVGRIENYRSRKGQDALLKKLTVKPAFFGRNKCDALPASSGRAGSQLRKDAKTAMVLLPIFAKEMFDARVRRNDFEMELSGAPRFNDSSPNHTNVGGSQLHSY